MCHRKHPPQQESSDNTYQSNDTHQSNDTIQSSATASNNNIFVTIEEAPSRLSFNNIKFVFDMNFQPLQECIKERVGSSCVVLFL